MIGKTYYRYIWLLDTLLSSDRPLTFEEIWMLWGMDHLDDSPLSIRTFHEHRKGVKEMFGVDIECDRSKNVYYVKNPEVIEKNKLAKWLLNKYSIPKEFVAFNGLKDRVLLEEIPLGQEFIEPIMEAMLHNMELKIEYQQYKGEHRQEFHFQPYALKVFNRRWYLLGYLKDQEELRTIALDRILALKVLSANFELPANFDANKYFANVVGIFVNKDLPIEKIKIRAYGDHADYLRSTPFHNSQSEGKSKHDEFAEFTYRLCVTPDLISQLLAMGEKVEVLEPKSLRNIIKDRLQQMIVNYGKGTEE